MGNAIETGVRSRDSTFPKGFWSPPTPSPRRAAHDALLAANGPLGAPGGTVFVRYANLAFEWTT